MGLIGCPETSVTILQLTPEDGTGSCPETSATINLCCVTFQREDLSHLY